MSKRNALVALPLLVCLYIIHKDDEVLLPSLEVNLDLSRFSASHLGWCCGGSVGETKRWVVWFDLGRVTYGRKCLFVVFISFSWVDERIVRVKVRSRERIENSW